MIDLVKLKVRKDSVTVDWCTKEGKDGTTVHRHTLEGGEAPHPDLVSALKQLLKPCLALLDLPERYATDCRVTTVIVSEQKGGRRGLQINLVKSLSATSRPLNLTTPLLVEAEEPNAAEGVADLHEEFWDLLGTVIREADAYVTGKRAQGDLFEAGPGAESEDLEEVEA